MTSARAQGSRNCPKAAIKTYAPPGEVVAAPDGFVAFGTAAFPDIVPYEGCATVGGTIFIRDAQMDGPGEHSNWSGDLHFEWEEMGGPVVVAPPQAGGFGSVLTERDLSPFFHPAMSRVPG